MNKNRLSRHKNLDEDFLKKINVLDLYKGYKPQWEKVTDKTKTLVIADPHEPFACDPLLRKAADEHKDAETVFVLGDLGDYYSKSRYRKTQKVDFWEEIAAVFHRIHFFSIRFKNVLVLLGNHDNRAEKKIANYFGDEIDLNILTERNLLEKMCSYFDNVKLVGIELKNYNGYDDIKLTHIFQYGDIIFTHGELSRVQPTALMQYISQKIHKWKGRYKLKPYRVFFQGHNHLGMKSFDGDEMWLLCPCSMETFSAGAEYVHGTRMVYNPPVLGYGVVYQDNGITDFNKTNIFVYDRENL